MLLLIGTFLLFFFVWNKNSAYYFNFHVLLLLFVNRRPRFEVFLTFINIIVKYICIILTGGEIISIKNLISVPFKLIIHIFLLLLLITQVTWWPDTHFIQWELTRRIVHDTDLLAFIILVVVDHVYFMAPYIISTSKSLGLVHLVSILQNTQLIAIRSNGMTRCWWVRKRRHSFVVPFVIDLQRMLSHFILIPVFESLVVEMSTVQLCWATSLIARIFFIFSNLFTWVKWLITITFSFYFVFNVICNLVYGISHMFRTLRHTPCWIRISLFSFDDLMSIVLVT